MAWGKSTGPRTKKGIDKIRQAHLKTGDETLAAKQSRSKQSLRLQQLEDAMHVLGMTTAMRSPGRKAKGYVRVSTVQEILEIMEK